MNRRQASVARATIDLLFSVVRKECVLCALNFEGISEDMIRDAIAALDDIAKPPPVTTSSEAITLPQSPAAIAAAKKARHRRR